MIVLHLAPNNITSRPPVSYCGSSQVGKAPSHAVSGMHLFVCLKLQRRRTLPALNTHLALVRGRVARNAAALLGPWRIRHVRQLVQVIPLRRGLALEVVVPVTDAELLVEGGVVRTDVGNAAPVLITHVEDLAVVLCVCVETHGAVRAVKREGQVRELLPSLGPVQDSCRIRIHVR